MNQPMFSFSSCMILFIVHSIFAVYPGLLCKVWDEEPFLDGYPFVPFVFTPTDLRGHLVV